jgi:hypothetical protein
MRLKTVHSYHDAEIKSMAGYYLMFTAWVRIKAASKE